VIHCGAIPAGLIESELFGHERGAFTGASHARMGAFENANGGTLLLDEIGELPLELQPKLLRVLEKREIRPVGSQAVRPIDVRVIAATNRRLAEASTRGEFRRDLFYRLAVVRVTVPPLRDRREDIAPIAQELLRSATGDSTAELPSDVAAMLTSYTWPGNVRELRNAIERYTFLGVRDARQLLEPSAEKLLSSDDQEQPLPYHEARRIALDRFERAYVSRVLATTGGVVVRAAELAQVGRASFYRLLQRVGLGLGS
jgi:transcriptional regulator with PAS, ATPase and Fis domain